MSAAGLSQGGRREPPLGADQATEHVEHMTDVCALPLVRRVAATFDFDPARYRNGDPLPRGWHVCLFTVPTRQSLLRADGAAGLGVTLPDVGLPRLMIGGRRIRFTGDIPIGAAVRRESRRKAVVPKEGRSGRFVIVTIQHDVFVAGAACAAIQEEQDYMMREAADTTAPAPAMEARAQTTRPRATASRTVIPDETLLFRYSAITFNPHRIHYDHPYATSQEAYPALVVNGGIASILLLELFKSAAGRDPTSVTARNVAPLFCGRALHLHGLDEGAAWRMWAEDHEHKLALEAAIE
jgi:3-methylfumaryl-CoA hydratase